MSSAASASVSGRSWPASAFVVGVKIGVGELLRLAEPSGRRRPCTVPVSS